jgi:peptide chain release factor 3
VDSGLLEQLTDAGPLGAEVARRRSFAIISHPDAGKSTLTEKILLYAGAIELAGAVRGRKGQRHVVSDWMAMEQQRGISLTAAALEFELGGCRMALLDTPGHQDFSEDTYRALVAADSGLMVIDAAKGIETQTRKLYDVCRRYRLPILTFVNKLDQPGREPLELLDDIESVLGIAAAPLNWPIGSGPDFRGLCDRQDQAVRLYDRTTRAERPVPVLTTTLADPTLPSVIGQEVWRELNEGLEVVEAAGHRFDPAAYMAGSQTGVFFGSALTNVGMEALLDALVRLAPPPQPRLTDDGLVSPTDETFSGFVFKVQANMDRRHRDRLAFVRVCSGRLEKDMLMHNARTGETIRASRTYRMFGRDRETAGEAVAGDVVGLVNPGRLAIGDTLWAGRPVRFPPMPRFPVEHFARLRLTGSRHKQFDAGVRQLEEEGLLQVFLPRLGGRDPMAGVVGTLQFDVIVARLRDEYGVEAVAEPLSLACVRWLPNLAAGAARLAGIDERCLSATDVAGRSVMLFPTKWALEYAERQNPGITFADSASA